VGGDEFEDFLRGLALPERVAGLLVGHEAGDAGDGLDVGSGLVGGGEEQDDDGDGQCVDAVEVHGCFCFADGESEFVDGFCFGVRDGESVADAGASDGFSSGDGVEGVVTVSEHFLRGEEVDHFFDGIVFVGGVEGHLNGCDG